MASGRDQRKDIFMHKVMFLAPSDRDRFPKLEAIPEEKKALLRKLPPSPVEAAGRGGGAERV